MYFTLSGYDIKLTVHTDGRKDKVKIIHLPQHRYDVVETLIQEKRRIQAIKYIHAEYKGIGLINAKNIVDHIAEQINR